MYIRVYVPRIALHCVSHPHLHSPRSPCQLLIGTKYVPYIHLLFVWVHLYT